MHCRVNQGLLFVLIVEEILCKKNVAQSAGFEPARGDPNGFLVHRLNHSATTAGLTLRLTTYTSIQFLLLYLLYDSVNIKCIAPTNIWSII